ncbi:PQQ-binding-like beta-propeller repeat protein [Cesiribacter sp. SM1]|uniref:PQQ-binding-like beta-propeller repeat protein n=1 Tax=Cesiribacter sp. SM1 TaxID=2861196 RepID=UPI001CD51668|nr:PQQ-binding-like beta-propeller repeat protein [Cesiribacter sp. SM1]
MKKLFLLLSGGAIFFSSCNSQGENTTSEVATTDTTATSTTQEPQVRLEQAWATEAVLETPESVYYNPDENVLYVSNIAGEPNAKDGKGYISKVSLDGQVVNKEWVTGLDAPKGMAMMNGTLYVTNVDELVAIDSNGKITNRYPVKGAKFLNDPVTADNKVLFTDMQDNKIYAFQDGNITVWKENNLNSPNGLAYHNGNVLVASNTLDVVSPDGENEELATGINAGDGIGIVDDNSYLVSNWHGEVYYVEKGKDKVKLLDTKDQNMNTADITYIPEQNMLLVPTFSDNRVVAYRLKR